MNVAPQRSQQNRNEVFLSATDVLKNGYNLELIGESGAGRTYLLGRLADYFRALGWQVLAVNGNAALENSPLLPLALEGIVDLSNTRGGPFASGLNALHERIRKGRTLILVDDGDLLDSASWGLLTLVGLRNQVPIAYSRAERRGRSFSPRSKNWFGTAITLSLPPMNYAELQTNLEAVVGTAIDPSTMSRVFAKSGGVIGLAVAIVRAGQSEGRIVGREGVLGARGSMWTATLRSVVDSMLEPLPIEDIAELRVLALFGPADLEIAYRLLSQETLLRLEEVGFLRILETGGSRVVSVYPPLIAEYFRHETPPGRRSAVISRIDQALASGTAPEPESVGEQNDPATFVRLMHERTRQATLRARERWQTRGDLSAAAQLLEALGADSSQPVDEPGTVIDRAEELGGSAHEQLEWSIAHARHIAWRGRRPDRAITILRRAALQTYSNGHRAEAELLSLQMLIGDIPAEEPFIDVDIGSLDRLDGISLLHARSFWLLVRGRVNDASELLEATYTASLRDPRLDAVFVQVMYASGRYEAGVAHARALLTEAGGSFDAPRVRAYSFLSAMGSVLRGDVQAAEIDLAFGASVGVPPAEDLCVAVGVHSLNSYVALRRGDLDLARSHLAGVEAMDGIVVPLPALQPDYLRYRLAALEGAGVAESASLTARGESLWKRGARLAAAWVYVERLRAEPTEALWAEISAHLGMIDSSIMARWVTMFDALFDGDFGAAVAVVRESMDCGDAAESARLASTALTVIRRGNHDPESPSDLVWLEYISRARRPRGDIGVTRLTSRESEIAELIASGLSNPKIAEILVVSVRTIESHINKILKKIGGNDRSDIRTHVVTQSFQG